MPFRNKRMAAIHTPPPLIGLPMNPRHVDLFIRPHIMAPNMKTSTTNARFFHTASCAVCLSANGRPYSVREWLRFQRTNFSPCGHAARVDFVDPPNNRRPPQTPQSLG